MSVTRKSRPRIGVSTYREQAAWGVWDFDAAVLPYTYVECVAVAGAIPLLLAPIDADDVDEVAAETVAALDGIVITGGPDIDPAAYGQAPHPETGVPRTQRDAWELALLEAALERDVPVLGICRGAQLMNVAHGGTLIQHLPEAAGATDHRDGVARFGSTRVSLRTDALPGSILGAQLDVSCYHHQAIAALGSGLSVTGRAPDGTVEAISVDGADFAVGVQWHPETDRELRLFAALAAAAARRGNAARTEKEDPART